MQKNKVCNASLLDQLSFMSNKISKNSQSSKKFAFTLVKSAPYSAFNKD